MTVKKTQKTLNTTLEKTEQTLDGLEQAFDSTVGAGPLANTGLPEEWCEIKISEVAEVVAGGTPKAGDPSNFADPGTSIAWLTPADLSKYKSSYISYGKRDLSQNGYDSSSAKLLPKGSLLFSSRAPIGYVAIASNEISTNQGFKNFVFQQGVNSLFAYYYLISIRSLAESLGTGTTFKEISGATAKTLPFILPPLAEQTVIAQTLDTLLAQVDNIKTRLDAIPKILKTFRQSVLAAAVSGKLTEEWRGESEWEETDLASLILASANGLSKRSGTEGDDITILRLADFKNAKRIYGKERRIKLSIKEQEKYGLLSDDILVIRVNGSVDLAGRFIKYSKENSLEGFCDHFIRLRLDTSRLLAAYLMYVANEGIGRHYLVNSLSTSAGQNTINQGSVKGLKISLPSIEEQTQIVRRVEELFAFADQIEQQVKNAQGRVNNLTQSILAKAFRGELTAQWRAENPDLISGDSPENGSAELLLAKIKAEREALKKISKPKKKTAVSASSEKGTSK